MQVVISNGNFPIWKELYGLRFLSLLWETYKAFFSVVYLPGSARRKYICRQIGCRQMCFGTSTFMLQGVSICMCICVSVRVYVPVNQSAYFRLLVTLQSYFWIIIYLLFLIFKDTHIIQWVYWLAWLAFTSHLFVALTRPDQYYFYFSEASRRTV